MRLLFSDMQTLRLQAKRNVTAGMVGLKHWWIDKYKLPATHKLFQKQSLAELQLEYFEDLEYRRMEIENELKSGQTQDSGHLQKQLMEIEKALGEKVTSGDPLLDKWDEQLARGEIPDLDEEW